MQVVTMTVEIRGEKKTERHKHCEERHQHMLVDDLQLRGH